MAESFLNNVTNIIEEKTCIKCCETKTIDNFSQEKTRIGNDRYRTECRDCRNKYRKRTRKSNPEWEKKRRDRMRSVVRETPEYIVCKICREQKHNLMFYDCLTSKNGKNSSCKKCIAKKTSERMLYADESSKKKRRERASRWNRKVKYGITPEMFDAILTAQNNCCAICNINLDKSRKAFIPQMDHCHASGRNRGILCVPCNLALGAFRDKEDLLMNAVKYLLKYKVEK